MPDAPYFEVDEIRADRRFTKDLADTDKYPDADVERARATAEGMIEGLDAEKGSHVAFVPRTETLDDLEGDGRDALFIPRYRITEISAVTLAGDDVDLATLRRDGMFLYRSSACWTLGDAISITVVHGFPEPPGRIRDAAMLLTWQRLTKGPLDERAISTTNPQGGTVRLAMPGDDEAAITGIPEVDTAIAQFTKPKPDVLLI